MFPVGGGGGGGGAFDFSGESQPISGGRVSNGGFSIGGSSLLKDIPAVGWVALAAVLGIVLVKVLR